MILGKKELGLDDTQIVENALSLWVATLIKNGELINKFYAYKRASSPTAFQAIKSAEDLITQGLFTFKSIKIRDEF